MSKPNKARYRLATLRQNAADKMGGDRIEFEAPDGTEFSIPAPGFWPDSAKEAVRAGDDIGMAKALFGADAYGKFLACGGRTDDLTLIFTAYGESQGSDLGE
jgi:hypothetical protein